MKADWRSLKSSLIALALAKLLRLGWKIEGEEEDVAATEEQPEEIEEEEADPVEEAETAAVTGEPEPEAPSSARAPSRSKTVDVMDSYPVSVQYLEDQYREYKHCTIDVNGSLQQAVRIGDQDAGCSSRIRKGLGLPDSAVQSGQHDQYLGLEVDEEGFADIDEVARCFKLNNKRAPESPPAC